MDSICDVPKDLPRRHPYRSAVLIGVALILMALACNGGLPR